MPPTDLTHKSGPTSWRLCHTGKVAFRDTPADSTAPAEPGRTRDGFVRRSAAARLTPGGRIAAYGFQLG